MQLQGSGATFDSTSLHADWYEVFLLCKMKEHVALGTKSDVKKNKKIIVVVNMKLSKTPCSVVFSMFRLLHTLKRWLDWLLEVK